MEQWTWWWSTRDAQYSTLRPTIGSVLHDVHIHERTPNPSPSPTDRTPRIRRRCIGPMPMLLGKFFPDFLDPYPRVELGELGISIQLR